LTLKKEGMATQDKPDVAAIAASARAVLKTAASPPTAALAALEDIVDALRRDYSYTDVELKPLTELIFELKN
jgi:hypothetical protein